MTANGQGPRAVTNADMPGRRPHQPDWSPHGLWIAFREKGDIYKISVDGGDVEQLTSHPALDYDPDWFDPTVLPVSSPLQQRATWGWLKTFGPRVLR